MVEEQRLDKIAFLTCTPQKHKKTEELSKSLSASGITSSEKNDTGIKCIILYKKQKISDLISADICNIFFIVNYCTTTTCLLLPFQEMQNPIHFEFWIDGLVITF